MSVTTSHCCCTPYLQGAQLSLVSLAFLLYFLIHICIYPWIFFIPMFVANKLEPIGHLLRTSDSLITVFTKPNWSL